MSDEERPEAAANAAKWAVPNAWADGICLLIFVFVPVVEWLICRSARGPGASTDGTMGAFHELPAHVPGTFPWAIVGELALVIYAYSVAAREKEWDRVLVGLAAWVGELAWEMVNGAIRYWHCYPLFGFEGQTAWQMYPGLTIEISLMFAVVPLVLFHLLPRDDAPGSAAIGRFLSRWVKISEHRLRGFRSRFVVPALLAAFCVFVESLLHMGGGLVWTWYFWRAPHVGVIWFSYCLPFLIIVIAYDSLKGRIGRCWIALFAVIGVALLGHWQLPHSRDPEDARCHLEDARARLKARSGAEAAGGRQSAKATPGAR